MDSMERMHILIVDRCLAYGHGLAECLRPEPDFVCVGTVTEMSIGLDLIARLNPDIVVLGVPDAHTEALAVCQQVRHRFPHLTLLVVGETVDEAWAAAMIGADIDGYVGRNCEPEELVHALRAVHRGTFYVSPTVAGAVIQHFQRLIEETRRAEQSDQRLTSRERQILELLASGKSSREIAKDLTLSDRTVENHIYKVYRKLKVHDRVSATQVAIRCRYISS